MDIKIAAAPISWGVCHVEGWGEQLPPERVFEEMRSLGLSATETVPHGWLPEDPDRARELLDKWCVTITGGYVPLVLYRGVEHWRPELEHAAERFSALGAEYLMVGAIDASGSYERRPDLDRDEWRRLLRALDEATRVAHEYGLLVVLHPHLGTAVERGEDIARVLDGCSASLCLDTGHVLIGEGDPGALARDASDRIGYVHLKDVDGDLADRYRRGELDFLGAVREGIFVALGEGIVDVAGVIGGLADNGYSGWYVLEQDVMLPGVPAPGGGPTPNVAESQRVLEELLAAPRLSQ
jgi:inosose dehydratase